MLQPTTGQLTVATQPTLGRHDAVKTRTLKPQRGNRARYSNDQQQHTDH